MFVVVSDRGRVLFSNRSKSAAIRFAARIQSKGGIAFVVKN